MARVLVAALLVATTAADARADRSCAELLRVLGAAARAHKAEERQRATNHAVNRIWPGSRASCEAMRREKSRREPIVALLDEIAVKSCLSPAQASSYRQMLIGEDEERERSWCP
jgi:hypothetical protein